MASDLRLTMMISENKVAILGILLMCITDSFAFIYPWPALPHGDRNPRHVHSPVASPLRYIMSHPLNKDRPAVTSMGHKLRRHRFEKSLESKGFEIVDGMSMEYVYEVYSVTDGVSIDFPEHLLTQMYLVPNYFMLSLEDAIKTYLSARNDWSAESQGSATDSRTWFPLMASGKGDYIIVNLFDGSVTEYLSGSDEVNSGFYFRNTSELFQYYGELLHRNRIIIDNGVPDYKTEQS